MSENDKKTSSETSNSSPEPGKTSGSQQYVPTLVGGGVFVLLALITLMMYLANN